MRFKIIFCFTIIYSNYIFSKPYKGAEYRTKESFKYGKFEVSLKSPMREGILASFFTYNDNYPNTDWNEIDIEILGRYSDDIQFNTITPGQKNHVSHYQTNFNPAKDFHNYGFEWTPEYISWFVDGVEVYRQTDGFVSTVNIPQKLMMNIWNPQYASWVGTWSEKVLPAFTFYDWVSYSSYTPGSGNTGTNNNFTRQWKDDFDSWDQSRWEKANHTWGGNGSDFTPTNAVLKDGKLILCLTMENNLGFNDLTPPSISFTRAEQNGLKVKFTEEINHQSAENISNYILVGREILNAKLQNDSQTVLIKTSNYFPDSLHNLIATNVEDRSQNKLIFANSIIIIPKRVKIPLFINCGGDVFYNLFLPTQEFLPNTEYGNIDGFVYNNLSTVSNTNYPNIYKTSIEGIVRYKIRIPDGNYSVTLMMTEARQSSIGKRIFSIYSQNKLIEKNLDLFAKFGKNVAYEKSFAVKVENGILEIHFMAQVDEPTLSGIQISAISKVQNEKIKLKNNSFHIGQNYPNPFNGTTVIPFEIFEKEIFSIKIFDLLGKLVIDKNLGILPIGKYNYTWNSNDQKGNLVSSGIYFYKIQNKNYSSIKKLNLIQ